MKSNVILTALTLSLLQLLCMNFIQAQKNINHTHENEPCGFNKMIDHRTQSHPEYDEEVKRYLDEGIGRLSSIEDETRSINTITIPVVVHVIHTGEAIGVGSNLSAERIQAQIDVMNEAFAAENSNFDDTPSQWASLIGRPNINFCLATVDPNGNSSTGITRHQMTVTGTSSSNTNIESTIKPATSWNSNLYYNIYVLPIPGTTENGGVLGYAYLPTPGLVGSSTDGVVLDYRWFGGAGFNQSGDKAMIHETGHYLGLFHTFNGYSCSQDDGINDTPNVSSTTSGLIPNLNCGSGFPTGPTTCGNQHMFVNYMDYVNDDRCYTSFSNGQINVMRNVLNGTAGNIGFASRLQLAVNGSVVCNGVAGCPTINLAVNTTAETCDRNDGTASVLATGGTSPYSYAWSTGNNQSSISGLGIGNYTVTVTDAESCSTTSSVTITSSCIDGCETPSNFDVINFTPTVYGSDNGGFVSGTNGYNDLAKAEYFNYTGGNTHVQGAFFDFAEITIANPSVAYVTLAVWDGAGGTPGAMLGSKEVMLTTIQNIAGSSPSFYIDFDEAIELNSGQFFIGVILPTSIGDALAVSTSTIGNVPSGQGTGWEQWSDGSWHNYNDNAGWRLDIANYIIPKLGTAPEINFFVEKSMICSGGSIDILNNTENADTYQWFFEGASNTSSVSSDPSNIEYTTTGVFDITLTATNDCIQTALTLVDAVTVVEIELMATSTPSTNSINPNGTATLSVNGGTAPYSFLWNTGETTPSLLGLEAGTYEVTVTDINNCSAYTNVIVEAVNCNDFDILFSTIEPLCKNDCNGSLSAFANQSGGDFSFIWSNGEETQIIDNLCAGVYTVTMTDNDGCMNEASFTLGEPNALSLSLQVTDLTAEGANDGNITVSVTGGVGQYDFEWSNGSSVPFINNLEQGDYEVTVSDGNSCTISSSATVGVRELECAVLSTSIYPNHVTCYGSSTGAATIVPQGGTQPYFIFWDNGMEGASINNLSAGDYVANIYDANGCSSVVTVPILEPSEIDISINGMNETNDGEANGTAQATVNGGTAPYIYMWSNGEAGETIDGLVSGVYSVTVVDANACTSTASITIESDAIDCSTLNFEIVTTNVSCNGGNDGSATVSGVGGLLPYTISWNFGITASTINNLGAGVYVAVISDENNCTVETTIIIEEPSPVTIIMSSTDETEEGTNDASATATVYGGTSPYSYEWSTGATSSEISGLSAGLYFLTVTDANDCLTISTVEVQAGEVSCAAFSSEINTTSVTCSGANDGTASITVSGGLAPYFFFWDNSQMDASITDLSPGTYTVTIADANQCTIEKTVVIEEPDGLEVSLHIIGASCGIAGTINTVVEGGTAPYQYEWDNGFTDQNISDLLDGNYVLTVTDANACSTTATAQLQIGEGLDIEVAMENVSCNGGENGTIDLTVTNGIAPYTYEWLSGETTESISNLSAGVYTVLVTDATGCNSPSSITILEPIALTIDLDVVHGDHPSITASVDGGIAPYTYLWSTGETTDQIQDLAAGEYTLTIVDSNGCEMVATAMIDESVAVSDLVGLSDLIIYPNPATDMVNVDAVFETSEPIELSLFDVVGRRVFYENKVAQQLNLQINVKDLASGTYFIRLSTDKGAISQKLIVVD